MGQPSLAIYATELFREYGVQQLVRSDRAARRPSRCARATSCWR
jgi:hypothetical protein